MRRDDVSTFLDVTPGEETQMRPLEEGAPFRILVLGNFSGGANRTRRPIRVDFDNFHSVLARMRPQLELPGPDAPIRIEFTSLDDFHPDALYRKLPLFQELSELRERALETPAAPPRRPAPPVDPLEAALGSGSLIDDILSGSEKLNPWQQTIRDIVSPHVQQAPDTSRATEVEDTIRLAMGMVLHHPEFQELESAWRSADFLMRRLELGPELQLYLLDLPRAELSGLARLLEQGEPWSVIVGLYRFAAEAPEFDTLASVARAARTAGAPFLASVSPRLLGCESFAAQPDPDDWTAALSDEAEEAWDRLRRLPESEWLGLALPRFLLRDPYTKDSIESFPFEEMTTPPDPAEFLWGNPAVACAFVMAAGDDEIANLPLYTYQHEGEVFMTPCAEGWMTERAAERILDRGIIPLASMKHTASVRLVRLQSIARPAAPLRGRWSD